MNVLARARDSLGGRLLFRTGRAGSLATAGRRSGRPRTTQAVLPLALEERA